MEILGLLDWWVHPACQVCNFLQFLKRFNYPQNSFILKNIYSGPPGYPGSKGDKGDRGDSVSTKCNYLATKRKCLKESNLNKIITISLSTQKYRKMRRRQDEHGMSDAPYIIPEIVSSWFLDTWNFFITCCFI